MNELKTNQYKRENRVKCWNTPLFATHSRHMSRWGTCSSSYCLVCIFKRCEALWVVRTKCCGIHCLALARNGRILKKVSLYCFMLNVIHRLERVSFQHSSRLTKSPRKGCVCIIMSLFSTLSPGGTARSAGHLICMC